MQQPTPTQIITVYGPLGLSALVIVGLMVGWLTNHLDFTTMVSIVATILAANGVSGLVFKQSIAIATIQGNAPAPANPARVPVALTLPSRLMPSDPQEDEQ